MSSPLLSQEFSNSASREYFVSADAEPNGDGSRERPFLLLSQVENVSAVGDTIYLLSSDTGTVLDGGIALKAQQSLEKFPESNLRQTLFELADFIVSREV